MRLRPLDPLSRIAHRPGSWTVLAREDGPRTRSLPRSIGGPAEGKQRSARWRSGSGHVYHLAATLEAIVPPDGVLVLTVTQFWPRNAALWAVARGAPNAAMGTVGFIASVRAISVPYTALEKPKPASLSVKLAYGAGIAAVLAFVAYFISKI